MYSIGTVARMLGISVFTLRKYEREGLIVSFKKKSGHRLYSASDVERAAWRCGKVPPLTVADSSPGLGLPQEDLP